MSDTTPTVEQLQHQLEVMTAACLVAQEYLENTRGPVDRLEAYEAVRDALLAQGIDLSQPDAPSSPTIGVVARMAKEMEAKLRANNHKGNRVAWLRSSASELTSGLLQEVAELVESVVEHQPPEFVWAEAADVANTAMMLADRTEHLEEVRRRNTV